METKGTRVLDKKPDTVLLDSVFGDSWVGIISRVQIHNPNIAAFVANLKRRNTETLHEFKIRKGKFLFSNHIYNIYLKNQTLKLGTVSTSLIPEPGRWKWEDVQDQLWLDSK